MSGIIGHTTYAILAAKAAEARKLPVAALIQRHLSSYLAGAYIGCDVQTMPAAICIDTGAGVGHGPAPIDKSPITGGKVRPFTLKFGEQEITPRTIHDTFYGRAHLILGWKKGDEHLKIPLSKMLDYVADVAGDAIEMYGPGERPLAYVMGWFTHVAGDGLIKSVLDGINLQLLDGKYTAKNRPIQDLISFNEIGLDELGLNWPALLDDLAASPVEPVQLHYMRCAQRRGRLGAHFEDGWKPEHEPLVRIVLAENRRYQRQRNPRLIQQLTLKKAANSENACDPELSRITGGMTYPEMKQAAENANFRHALWQMGEIIADLFEKITNRQEKLQDLPVGNSPDWEELTKKWLK
ncbi:MAG: hypothetical protein P1V20_14705 [Verrucomicrobiales bacterium]|nr:hypothetical protein [Verrucomicrobiales bacterium]